MVKDLSLKLDSIKVRMLSGLILGVLLAIMSIVLNTTPYMLLVIYFLNFIPAGIIYKVLIPEASTKEMFTKGLIMFYAFQFIVWVVIYDIFMSVIHR